LGYQKFLNVSEEDKAKEENHRATREALGRGRDTVGRNLRSSIKKNDYF